MGLFAKVNPIRLILCLSIALSLGMNISMAQNKYKLAIQTTDIKEHNIPDSLKLKTTFLNKEECNDYVVDLIPSLRSKGFLAASIDSIYFGNESAIIKIFFGNKYSLKFLSTSTEEKRIIEMAGIKENEFYQHPPGSKKQEEILQRILNYLSNTGYPFATVQVDSLRITSDGNMAAILQIDKSAFHKIDSIRVIGEAKISNQFLQRFISIRNGSPYDNSKLSNVDNKLRELAFIEPTQPWNMTMVGTGSVLNLYLKSKKSSQINGLIGFLPNNAQLPGQKLQVIGEANVLLRNQFSGGETIGFNWQQIQVESPRINLLFQKPFIFNAPFGLDLSFDMLKKDSSYLNLNLNAGIQYLISGKKSGKIFLQAFSTNLLEIDTLRIKQLRMLPAQVDIRSINLGVEYNYLNTNYRYNPIRGYEFNLELSAGTRNIRRNTTISSLLDPQNAGKTLSNLYDSIKLNSYRVWTRVNAARYFPIGKQSTIKAGLTLGFVESPILFRNELFQVGGSKVLRGFDEESIFSSRYMVATGEYRYLIGVNSYLFGFTDFGWARNSSASPNIDNYYLGLGAGMAFETGAGIFKIAYAVGKQNDLPFDFRQSKIHIAYTNIF